MTKTEYMNTINEKLTAAEHDHLGTRRLLRAFPDMKSLNYADTLAQLQALFYHFKQESHDRIPDDELIAAMAQCFDGRAQGALDALAGLTPEELCVPDREARWEPAP
mgnify:FL=1